MDTNYFSHYLTRQAEHQIRLTQSARFELARQAAALQEPVAQPTRSHLLPMRRWISAALIAAGERLQGQVSPAIHSMEPLPSESAR